jgi:putative transposase
VIPTLALAVARDLIRVLFRSRAAAIAENLFLWRQLALYQERKIRRSRPNSAAKFALVILSRFFPWASAL